jgi:hypothetical protein
MPAEVRDRVHGLARRANAKVGLTFTDSDGQNLDLLYPPDDDDNDSDFDPDDASSASSHSSDDSDAVSTSDASDDDGPDGPPIPDLPAPQHAEIAGVDNTINVPGKIPGVADNTPGVNEIAVATNTDTGAPEVDNADLETYVNELKSELDQQIADLDDDYEPTDDDNDNIRADNAREQASADVQSDSDNDPDADETPLPRIRRNRIPSYGHLKGCDSDGSLPTVARPEEFRSGRHEAHIILQNIVMAQYNLKQGIRKFGNPGKAAVMTELQQLYDQDVMILINKYYLTAAERKGALGYLMFLKEKRCGTIKGRGCADGRPHCDYMTKQKTSSPTVATEALMLTCVIDAIEERDVATCDTPGAFMQSDMKGKVAMKLEGIMAEVILQIDPKKYTK